MNWWEPTFSPDLANSFTEGDWTLPDQAAHRRLFDASSLQLAINAGVVPFQFREVTFNACDFAGDFTSISRTIVFIECTFKNCDFGLTTWGKVKFKKCTFDTCSITQTRWIGAEFRECEWSDIGVSGNETVLEMAFIDNPISFISGISTNTSKEAMKKGGVTARSQVGRLQETKATVARNLYNSLKNVGDEDAFYEACQAHLQQTCRARQANCHLQLMDDKSTNRQKLSALFRLAGADIETLLVGCFGRLTKWGGSISRPLIGLALVVLTFLFVYHFAIGLSWFDSFSHSFDIATVTGYGRAVQPTDGGNYLYVAWLELVLSILFYTIFFTVAVAKISRVR